MNGNKRSYSSQKGTPSPSAVFHYKNTAAPSTSRTLTDTIGSTASPMSVTNSPTMTISDHIAMTLDNNDRSVPMIRQCENNKILPKYTAILNRKQDGAVNMDDLDQLQLDLEKLISTCAVRNRFLRGELETLEPCNEDPRRRGCKDENKATLKRKRNTASSVGGNGGGSCSGISSGSAGAGAGGGGTTQTHFDDGCSGPKSQRSARDAKPNASKLIKKQFNLVPVNVVAGAAAGVDQKSTAPFKPDLPRINLPKNETSDRFWATVEPFCAPISKTNILFLDKLIEECSQNVEMRVPDLGEHYTTEWNENLFQSEQDMSGNKTENGGNGGCVKKQEGNPISDMFMNPITRLLALLIEEKVMPAQQSNLVTSGVLSKLKASDFNLGKSSSVAGIRSGTGSALCMERRLRKNLIEQGLFTPDELPKTLPEDEVLLEIERCQSELVAIHDHTVGELSRLKKLAERDLRRQEIKAQLEQVDTQILEMYNKILGAKEHAQQLCLAKDDELDRETSTRILKDFELQTVTLLKQQSHLQSVLNELDID